MNISSTETFIRLLCNGQKITIEHSEIVFLEAMSNYTLIKLVDGRHFISSYTLLIFDNLLKKSNFNRINRSTLVNWSYVREVDIKNLSVYLNSGQEIIISRRKAKKLTL